MKVNEWIKRGGGSEKQGEDSEFNEWSAKAVQKQYKSCCVVNLKGRGSALEPVSKDGHFFAESGGCGRLTVGACSYVKQNKNAVQLRGPK